MDMTIITTALPTIATHFNSSAAYVWIGAAYMLGDGASTPVWGKISDIFGRKPILLIATIVFFVGGVMCGAATSMDMLIAGRAVQGTGGGGLLTLTSMVISDMFSIRERPKYYGFIGMTWAIANSTGPVLGGLFAQKGRFLRIARDGVLG
jgi:MFS family permease